MRIFSHSSYQLVEFRNTVSEKRFRRNNFRQKFSVNESLQKVLFTLQRRVFSENCFRISDLHLFLYENMDCGSYSHGLLYLGALSKIEQLTYILFN